MSQEFSATEVAKWLKENPSFFQEQSDLFADLKVPHPHEGHAISLIERQILLLRDKNRQLAARYAEMLRYGEQNDLIISRTHALAKALLRASDASRTLLAIYSQLRHDFSVPHVEVRFVHPRAERLADNYLTAAALPELDRYCETPYCGPLASETTLLCFPSTPFLSSFALIGLRSAHGENIGLLALASEDVRRFTPDMSVDLLVGIGELVSAAFEKTLGIR